MPSFISSIDIGMKANIFSVFDSIMGLTDYTKDITFNPKDIAFREIAEKRGEVQMEFINLWRDPPEFSWDRQRSGTARRGMNINDAKINIKAVPVDLNYEVTFWTHSLEVLQQISETYLFWIHTDPNLNINYDLGTSNTQFPLEIDMHFGKPRDDSQIIEKYAKGRYFAYTLPIKLDGWIFTNVDVKEILHIYVKVYDFTKTDGTVSEESILLTEWEEHAVT
jgi:hypothetical protein